MSHFSKTDDWRVVNPFTIEHAGRMKDRPFMTTCVPKSLHLSLRDITIVYVANWSGDSCPSTENKANSDSSRFYPEHRIVAKADLDHDITVFRVPEGQVQKFKNIEFITIRADRSSTVGGIHNATTRSGISYSGMSSREVPERGLMEGEPGSLYYVDATDDEYDRELSGKRYLGLELYIQEERFNQLIEHIVSSGLQTKGASAYTNIELFEYEVDASLSEPWHRHDYGLMQSGRPLELASTRARLHTLSFFFSPKLIEPTPTSDEGDGVDHKVSEPAILKPIDNISDELTLTVRRYGKAIVAVGIAVLLALLLK